MAVAVSRILHAGYVFESGGTRVAFDPIFENPFSRNCHAYPMVDFDVPRIRELDLTAVFISHFHDDHCSLESLDLLDKKTPIFIYCPHEQMLEYIRELGFTRVEALSIDRSVTVGPFEVTPRLALDADVDSIFHVKAEGLNILNVVDSWIDPATMDRLALEEKWDLVLWPFQTMREIAVLSPRSAEPASRELPPEWVEQIQRLRPRVVVPSSCQFVHEPWSWYNRAMFPITYRQFETEMTCALPEARIVRLDPSRSVVLDGETVKTGPELDWVRPMGRQDVDYEFDSEVPPPSTAEIAKHFAPLSHEETDRVFSYCRFKIPERHQEIGESQEEYFARPIVWRLSLYDHRGEPTHFLYRMRGERVELIDARESEHPVAWTTEVPISRLLGALEAGESLTSMYLRINDSEFPPEIERDIRKADVVEDPLIRSLFNGVFGGYQRAQLARIKECRSKTPIVDPLCNGP
jgi:L-ascorbate metabolism protein UlaG (beta-lactamase superfamily)